MSNYKVIIEKLKKEVNPVVKASIIGRYFNEWIREKKINLYESYLLNAENIRLQREGYLQSGWNKQVQISTCIAVLNMKMMAYLYHEKNAMSLYDSWAKEAYEKNREIRDHYIINDYEKFLDFVNHNESMQQLLDRRNNKRKPFDKGPYHTEIFPYDLCNMEYLIIHGEFLDQKEISDEVEDLIIGINLF